MPSAIKLMQKGVDMAYQVVFKQGFLDRAKRMSGLKTDASFAGASGISESALSRARKTEVATPAILVGLYSAFGFQPGEVTTIAEVPESQSADQSLAA